MPIKIYTTPSCVYCKMAKQFFQKNKVEYQEIDVIQDLKAREEMVSKSHQLGVPVIEIGNQIFVGFNRPEIEKALGVSK